MARIQVTAKTNARKDQVIELEPGKFQVLVNAPPRDNEANEAIIALLAKHFKVPKSRVTLVQGSKSKQKVFDIE